MRKDHLDENGYTFKEYYHQSKTRITSVELLRILSRKFGSFIFLCSKVFHAPYTL